LNWVQYMNQMLTAIKSTGGVDGIAVHINSRGYSYSDIHSTQKVSAGGQNLYFSFYVYKDWVDHGIPADLYHLPIYATESNGIHYWSGNHPEDPGSHYEPGWMQEVYAEIDRYNTAAATSGKPIFRCVNMYRWCGWCDGWNIDGSPYEGQILTDLSQAVAAGYTWPGGSTPPPPPPPSPRAASGPVMVRAPRHGSLSTSGPRRPRSTALSSATPATPASSSTTTLKATVWRRGARSPGRGRLLPRLPTPSRTPARPPFSGPV
jgi:hypothetical protein